MARSRNIKPGFFRNEVLAELDFGTRLLFIGLWTLADKAGRLEDRPKKIKIEVFPADDVDVPCMLDALAKHGFITRYTVSGTHYIQINNFLKHQSPHHKEPESDLPSVESADQGDTETPDESDRCESTDQAQAMHKPSMDQASPQNDTSSPLIPDSLIPDSGYPIPEKQQGVRDFPVKGEKVFSVPEHFVDELKSTYPRIDVEYQLQKARLWLVANPSRQKTLRGMTRFLNNWMSNQKPTAEIHPIQSRHSGFEDRDYSEGLIKEAANGKPNF